MAAQPTRRIDFWVQYTENQKELALQILDYVFLERTRCNKQTILVITGDPGEAKSSISQALVEKLLEHQGISYAPFVNDVTIYTPVEFPDKEHALLYDPRLKDICVMIIDEARLVVKAKNWHEFLNQTIADVVALQRRVKRVFLIIVTQDLDDIDKDVRRLITYWGEAYRPLHGPAELHISRFYKDTRNPSRIELQKRSLRGIIEFPDGSKRLDFPSSFEFNMPSKEVWETYDEMNYKSKGLVLKSRLTKLIERMKKDAGMDRSRRVDLLLNHYLTPERYQELQIHFRISKQGRYRLREGALELLGLDKSEADEFCERAKSGFLNLSFKKQESAENVPKESETRRDE